MTEPTHDDSKFDDREHSEPDLSTSFQEKMRQSTLSLSTRTNVNEALNAILSAGLEFRSIVEGATIETPNQQVKQQFEDFLARVHQSLNDWNPLLAEAWEGNYIEKNIPVIGVGLPLGGTEPELVGTYFLRSMHGMAEDLIEKHRLVAELSGDQERMYQELSNITRQSAELTELSPEYLKEHTVRLEYTPFSISIVLDKKGYEKCYHDGDGIHLRGTCFNIIKESTQEREQRSMQHENLHCILDRSLLSELHGTPAETLEKELDNLHKQKELTESLDNGIDFYGLCKQEFLKNTATILTNLLWEEMLCALEEMESRNFEVPKYAPGFESVMAVLSELPENKRYHRVFSTAGSEVRDAVRLLKAKERSFPDNEIASKCRELRRDLKTCFSRSTDAIRAGLYISEKLGGTAPSEVTVLAAILKPAKWHWIPRHLETSGRYDRERVADLHAVFDALEGQITPETMRAVAAEHDNLSETDIAQLHTILGQDFDKADVNVDSVEELRELCSAISEATSVLGFEDCKDGFTGFLYFHFTFEELFEGEQNGWEQADQLVAVLSEDYPKQVAEAVLTYVMEKASESDFIRSLQVSPLRQVVHRLGIQEQVDKIVEQSSN